MFCVCAEKKGEIDKLAEEYVVKVKNFASEQRVEHLQKIQNAYSKCKEFSDDKVQLAMQTYEMVSLLSLSWIQYYSTWICLLYLTKPFKQSRVPLTLTSLYFTVPA